MASRRTAAEERGMYWIEINACSIASLSVDPVLGSSGRIASASVVSTRCVRPLTVMGTARVQPSSGCRSSTGTGR